MAKKQKNPSRRQMDHMGLVTPTGSSKYAVKVARRKKAAEKVGLPATATFPEIWNRGG